MGIDRAVLSSYLHPKLHKTTSGIDSGVLRPGTIAQAKTVLKLCHNPSYGVVPRLIRC